MANCATLKKPEELEDADFERAEREESAYFERARRAYVRAGGDADLVSEEKSRFSDDGRYILRAHDDSILAIYSVRGDGRLRCVFMDFDAGEETDATPVATVKISINGVETEMVSFAEANRRIAEAFEEQAKPFKEALAAIEAQQALIRLKLRKLVAA